MNHPENQFPSQGPRQAVVAESPGLITSMIESLKDIMRIQEETAETILKIKESFVGAFPEEEERKGYEPAHTLVGIRDLLPILLGEAAKQREELQSLLNTLGG